ncbi:MAG: M56 family metallopeptidase [Deltaproteobacteria bacterium]|nr:M56 family metallopeptidase [Deltaproteobacteria bacterium]
MTVIGAALWNLVMNAAVSLAFALLGGAIAARLVRARHPRLAVVLLATPFVKAAYEVARGIPSTSFFWLKLGGAAQELGTFRVGLGLRAPAILDVQVVIGAISNERGYDQSIADVVATGLSRHVAPWLAPALGFVVAALALLPVAAWAARRLRSRRERAAIARSAEVLETRRIGVRAVRIALVDGRGLIPFAFGVISPWVCIPRPAWAALTEGEREAVIAHELAHLRFFDELLVAFVDLVATALWFVPGARAGVRAFRAQIELGADAWAARSVPATMLASALVRIAELARGAAPEHASALLGPPRLLSRRVVTLVEAPPPPSRARRVLLSIATLLLTTAILRATTLGNP